MSASKTNWLRVEARADHARMYIDGPIGESTLDESGTSSAEFITELNSIPKAQPVKVFINSYGGSCPAAMAMYDALKTRGNVTTYISGVAMSAATIVALGGSKVISPEASIWMI